ncbi:hypothetical protein Scep_010136 [Stephania cephalantha]|uniref:Uncharacterized protein n=1 Tax=Stephania cephalantha TaxID=152367 RepID=A0AAP0PGS7_9MAGN
MTLMKRAFTRAGLEDQPHPINRSNNGFRVASIVRYQVMLKKTSIWMRTGQ